jgi:hypothetical protein
MAGTAEPPCDDENVSPTQRQKARAARIAAQLGQIGFALPGTVTERLTRCGRANCSCHADPPVLHGPYHQWTRKIGGKTVTRLLTDDQLADYQPWFDNDRRLRALITELEALSQAIADADPRTPRRTRPTVSDTGQTGT